MNVNVGGVEPSDGGVCEVRYGDAPLDNELATTVVVAKGLGLMLNPTPRSEPLLDLLALVVVAALLMELLRERLVVVLL